MSSSELYLLYSLRGSPVPLGGRLELLSLGGGLDAAVVEWALEEAGPGLAFAPLVGAVEVVLGPCVFEPVVCCGLWLVGSSPPLVSPTSVKAGVFVCADALVFDVEVWPTRNGMLDSNGHVRSV